ncbi:hypothetical protein B0H34DRAFT_783545 [Crassisporium funariophilum]|nr:hypothetical protein B0H34DRAFT_783545 [Crassisporium funariophilum]
MNIIGRFVVHLHTTCTTDAAYKKILFAFQTDPPIPTISSFCSQTTFLSGFKPKLYNCCLNSCCCYIGPHAELKSCPYCSEDHFKADGQPCKCFMYIPIIPRLKAFAANTKIATSMKYHSEYKSIPNIVAEIPNGAHYSKLRKTRVKIGNKVLDHQYFSDPLDVALGLLSDGFAPFNNCLNAYPYERP